MKYRIIKYKSAQTVFSPEVISCSEKTLIKDVVSAGTFYLLLLIVSALCLTSCRKFVEVTTPPDKITQENVFSTDISATTALTGIYYTTDITGAQMTKFNGLLADEFTLFNLSNIDHFEFYTNGLLSTISRSSGKDIWNAYYNYIFRCNQALEEIIDNENLSPFVERQLTGEAHFLRAWFYFHLVNLYGDIPLVVGTDPNINRLLSRSSTQKVYELIVDDLVKAESLLSPVYVNGQLLPYSGIAERVRPTKWAAIALLARVYLHTNEHAKAEVSASKLIEHTSLFSLSPLNEVFLKNKQEAIWQLQPDDIGWNTWEGRFFHLSAAPTGFGNTKFVHLSSFMLSAFELGDKRFGQWVDSLTIGSTKYYFPVKYKIGVQNSSVNSVSSLTEYSMMLRLGEQYLIRAEARARQNNLAGAITDVDMLRARANIPLVGITNPGISQSGLLAAILHERQVELFAEWGHRWYDIKRFGEADNIMGVVTGIKGGSWEPTDKLMPIPFVELLRNPNMTQNAGY
jgi:starch-binding outer membrane protein, SusD/RagB family